MKEKKINYALKRLNVYELNSFRKFLISPYFNQNNIFVTYFDLLNEKIRKEEDINDISNEEIWRKIYGDTEYDDIRFRKVVSDFYKLFDHFITFNEIETDNFEFLNPKLKAYKIRNLSELYPTVVQNLESIKKIQKDKSAEFYLQSYNIEKSLLSFKTSNNLLDRKLDLSNELNLDAISLNLDVFYITEKLRYYCNFLNLKKNYKITQKIAGIDFIIKLAKTELFRDYPPIAIYYAISLTLIENENISHFYKLKELMKNHLHLFPKTEAKEIIESAISYAVTKGNKGFTEFELESYELYKFGLENDFLILDNKITTTTFRNIIFFGLRQSEYQWVEHFIETYSLFLPESERENNVNFSLARLEWYRKNWGEVIRLLSSVEYKEVFQALLSRTLLILSYFELSELESLDSLLISFKSYLDREKSLTKERKMPYYNLIQFVKRLTKLRQKDKEKLQKLRDDVTTTEGIVNKAWLLEKIDEISSTKKKINT